MRLIATLKNQAQGESLSAYLSREGICNELEISANTDWGNSEYGDLSYRIWVINEHEFSKALKIADEFALDPLNPIYLPIDTPSTTPLLPSIPQKIERKTRNTAPKINSMKVEPIGIMTLYVLISCCVLFFFSEVTAPTFPKEESSIPFLTYSSLEKELMFDYPEAFEILETLVKTYGVEALQDPQQLPEAGRNLLMQFYKTPYWTGFYSEILAYTRSPIDKMGAPKAPLFEKIKEGQYWRLFSPALLHADIFHLLFNMVWVVTLGRQIELRMGRWRYVLFILISGIFTNTAQYFMGGPNFVGFSGVICAMLSFVWMRQITAPWEGYALQPSTMKFMMFFLLMVLSLQIASFFSELYTDKSVSPAIANTAHMSGLAIGLLFGKINFFSWK